MVADSPPVAATTFEEFFVAEYAGMVALAAAAFGQWHAAEDIAQEALARADRHWSRISRYERPGAWLRRVTLNLAISHRRRLRSELRAKLRFGAAAETSLSAPALEDEEVWDAVAALPAKQRAAVSLYYLEDRSTADIADILEISEATARVHLHRGRSALATALEHRRDER